jgi:hypothetical protein
MKNVLVLQHIAIEDPGYIKDLMEADGWQLTQIELDEGETIPGDLAASTRCCAWADPWIPGWKTITHG